MKIKNAFLLSLAMFLIGMAGFSAAASATTGAGGQVSSKGQITFYEKTTESSTTVSSSEVPADSSSTATSTGKPQGGENKLPSTGEMIQKYSLMGTGIVLLIALILFYRRKKEEKQG